MPSGDIVKIGKFKVYSSFGSSSSLYLDIGFIPDKIEVWKQQAAIANGSSSYGYGSGMVIGLEAYFDGIKSSQSAADVYLWKLWATSSASTLSDQQIYRAYAASSSSNALTVLDSKGVSTSSSGVAPYGYKGVSFPVAFGKTHKGANFTYIAYKAARGQEDHGTLGNNA